MSVMNVIFRASFPDGVYEKEAPRQDMASAVRLILLEAANRDIDPLGWRITRSALAAWESLYKCVEIRPATDEEIADMYALKPSRPQTIGGLPLRIIDDSDEALVHLDTMSYHDEVMRLREREYVVLLDRMAPQLRDRLRESAAAASVPVDEFAARWFAVADANIPSLTTERDTRDDQVLRYTSMLGWAFSEGVKSRGEVNQSSPAAAAIPQPCEEDYIIAKLADSPDIQKTADFIYSKMQTPFNDSAYRSDTDGDRHLIALGIAAERNRAAKTVETLAFNKCEFCCDAPFELGKKIRGGE